MLVECSIEIHVVINVFEENIHSNKKIEIINDECNNRMPRMESVIRGYEMIPQSLNNKQRRQWFWILYLNLITFGTSNEN